MPNDARLGLVVGVALVIAVAVFFVRKDVSSARPLSSARAGSATSPLSGKAARATPPSSAKEPEDEGAAFTVASPKEKPDDQEP